MEKDKHLGLRIDSETQKKLKSLAEFEGRSINGQVLYLVRQAIARREHENGPLNPIILFARLTQRLIGLVNRKHWHYRNTIKQYFVPKEIDGFTIKYKSETGLITPILLCLQYFNIKEPKLLSDFLSRTDEVLLDRMSFLKRYTFLKIVIYKKNN